MKKLKVYIKYPWVVSDSQYYKNIINYPPRDIEFVNSENRVGIITNKKTFFISNFLKKGIRFFTGLFDLPIANAHFVKSEKEFDLIHCAHCLSKNNSPWVADFEAPWQFWISGRDTKNGKEIVKKILMDKNCKKLMAWTETAKKELIAKFPEVADKVDVVSHALPVQNRVRKNKRETNLLFMSRYFYEKGGEDALEVLDRLTKAYSGVNATVVSPVPPEIRAKYSENKKMKIFEPMPYSKILDEIFPEADILVYPGYSDTFGFVFCEAMSFGIPIVTVDGYARKDIVAEGKTGFVIKNRGLDWNKKFPIVKERETVLADLVRGAGKLIENKKLRERMSKNCLEEIKNGKFSIKRRNEKLNEIYHSVLA